MDAPHDPVARRDALERWADQQKRRSRRPPLSTRVVERVIGRDRLIRTGIRVDRFADRVFDQGFDTASVVQLPLHSDDRVLYVPSRWHVLPRALRYLGVSDEDCFVDFGCGKGRVVHQAARWPFKRVIGVEVSPELAEEARALLKARSHQHRAREVEVVVSDVREYQVPDDLTIGYFFHPFGRETLDMLLGRIVESIDRRPRRVRLIYVLPDLSRWAILDTGRFRVVKQQSSVLRGGIDRVAIFESR